MTWLDEARGWAEDAGRDIKRKGEGLVRTYRPVVERAAADAEARLRAHRAAMEKVGWLAGLARAPKKGGTGQRAAPVVATKPQGKPARPAGIGMFARETPAQAERQALFEQAFPSALAVGAFSPLGLGLPGVAPALIDDNGVRREVTDEEFARRVPAQLRPILAQGEKLEYGDVQPRRFVGPNRHLNMRISDVGVTDPRRLATAMKTSPAPGVTRSAPVGTGDRSFVGTEHIPFVPGGYLPGGMIEHWTPPGTQTVVNATRFPHVFDRGFAGRMPSQNPDGTTRITTVSAGTNQLTGWLNQWLGPGQFGLLDERVAGMARPEAAPARPSPRRQR